MSFVRRTTYYALLFAVFSLCYGFPFRIPQGSESVKLGMNESLSSISRILNGRNANSEEVKRFVQLHITVKKKRWIGYRYRDVICGAIMRQRRWLISAAHCFVDIDNSGYRYHQKGSYVRYGRNDFDQGFRTNIARVYVHKNFFGKSTLHYDIALILLSEDLNGYNGKPIVNGASSLSNLITMGFGDTKEQGSSTPDILQVGALDTGCTRRNRDSSIGSESQMIACYGSSSVARTCQGDSGGPLLSKYGSTSYTLAGIVSHGAGGICPKAFTDMWFTDYSRFSSIVSKATTEDDFSSWKIQP